jgi:hypothetical protein
MKTAAVLNLNGAIKVGPLIVLASGGLAEVCRKAYREPLDHRLSLAPEIARKLAAALLEIATVAERVLQAAP